MQKKISYKMTKAKFKRILAFFMAINIFFEVISPTVALALTSGPGQPEMASFEPVGTTDMVDVFSGDFNYNIPLLTVPGPNGGYPINMAYHSGIAMDDEASWVGLGWNINPGVISRNMRGLPDDFSGESVTKTINMRPNRTANLGFGIKFPEIWGMKLDIGFKHGMSWNNYKGFGFSSGISISGKANKNGIAAGVAMSYNSMSGETSLTPSMSLSDQTKRATNTFALSASISSLNGLKDLNFTMSRVANSSVHSWDKNKNEVSNESDAAVASAMVRGSSRSASTSFASSAFTPPAEFPSTGFNVSSNFSLGVDIVGVYGFFDMNASYDQTKYENDTYDFAAYGYLHSEERGNLTSNSSNEVHKLMDFNREKDAPLNKDIPAMPIPVATYDIYMVKGQGIGGTFRPYRTDIPLLADPAIFGENSGGSLGAEVGLGVPTLNFGLNLAVNYSKTYSGPWNELKFWEDIYYTTNSGHAYFKQAGEMVADDDEETDFYMNGTYPIAIVGDWDNRFDLSIDPTDMDELMSPIVEVRADLNGVTGAKSAESNRKTRSNLMSYKTFDEVSQIPGYEHNFVERSVYGLNANPLSASNVSYSGGSGRQIAEMSVINPDGNRYIYALPAKNVKQREVSFALPDGYASPTDKIVSYSAGDNSTGNQNGEDHFYSSTEIPSYVHSYLLTAIVSPDYIDLKDDGLTDDDFGYWVKFNYTKTASNYKWRMPFDGANLLTGHVSADFDDKAGYTYGEKELWFLNSIETKSHIALFSLSDRSDAKGAKQENNTTFTGSPNSGNMELSTGEQKQLDKISLYSKVASPSDPPLKEVNFTYNYELCKNTLNSNASGGGKLTLKEVSFSYMGNAKGALSPYRFDYHESDPQENPDYGILKEDVWGNYKADMYGSGSNIFPYASQLEDYDGNGVYNNTKRNKNASAWNLKEITLPSGGKIKVDYESDDYAYVHDKKAQELVRIIGFGPDLNLGNMSMEMTQKNKYLFFEIPHPSTCIDDASVKKYAEGLKEVYFKVFTDLKKNGIEGIDKIDYVTGYAEIDNTDCGLASSSYAESVNNPHPAGPSRTIKVGYVKVVPVDISDQISGAKTHPFRKAGWQYLKLQRRDVLFPSSAALSANASGGLAFLIQAANAAVGAFTSSMQLFTGFYTYCSAAGYCKEMVKNHYGANYPSFIRLNNTTGIKYGGGHRVKQIAITDTWQETGATENESKYGQEYSYRLPSGISSGVAAYEPLIGGEEIPYRKPIRYSSPYFILKNENLYMEEPIGESYYPAPTVGYSRVIVKNIRQTETPTSSNEITKTREGTTVHEFYTTKDFPYTILPSYLNHEKFTPNIPIPLIGSVNFENHGFSQSIRVYTNDMHGKAKSVATYAAGTNVNGTGNTPVSKVEYIYNTNASGQLSNRVNVLYGDAYYRDAAMGITEEKYIDNRQTFGITMNQGLQTNLDWTLPYIFVPTFAPIIDYSETMYKSIVNVKVTSATGILMETRTFNEGSTVTSKNLLFDAYTGKPLLTTVTNDFDKPIYKYEFAGHWAYSGMGNAYRNDRAIVNIGSGGSISGSENVFPGDELLIAGTRVWVKPATAPDYQAILANGSNASVSGQALVIRSGRRNQQSVSNGYIVSLTDPVNSRIFNLFSDYNTSVNASSPITTLESTDCGTGVTRTYQLFYTNTSSNSIVTFRYCVEGRCCYVVLTFPYSNSINWQTVNFKKAGKKVYALDPVTQTVLSTGDITDDCGLSECLDGVLNVAAAEFKHKDWNHDYVDAGDPDVVVTGSTPTKLATEAAASVNNPYRLGTAGIWRTEKSYAYQTERKQNPNIPDPNTTKIQEDGTFKEFVLFDWDKQPITYFNQYNNPKWTKTNEVTRYNPNGFELENKNAIDIYTSALYGYNNSVQTGITNNAMYFETAFDGFEDYGASTFYTSLPSTMRKGGHINLTPGSGTIPFSGTNYHSGKKSIAGTGTQVLSMSAGAFNSSSHYLQIKPNGKYTVSAWFKTANGKPEIAITGATSYNMISDNVKIEGWEKVDVNFTTDASASTVTIDFKVNNTSSVWFLDDVRIQPFQSTMKTFVYDPKTLWLVAELDNQNYATFYNYDEEGTLTQVKKETVNGVQTLKTTRSNVKR